MVILGTNTKYCCLIAKKAKLEKKQLSKLWLCGNPEQKVDIWDIPKIQYTNSRGRFPIWNGLDRSKQHSDGKAFDGVGSAKDKKQFSFSEDCRLN